MDEQIIVGDRVEIVTRHEADNKIMTVENCGYVIHRTAKQYIILCDDGDFSVTNRGALELEPKEPNGLGYYSVASAAYIGLVISERTLFHDWKWLQFVFKKTYAKNCSAIDLYHRVFNASRRTPEPKGLKLETTIMVMGLPVRSGDAMVANGRQVTFVCRANGWLITKTDSDNFSVVWGKRMAKVDFLDAP